MEEYIIYNSEYHVLICRQHGYAIPPNGIVRHFRQLHKAIPLSTRQAIVQHIKSLDLYEPDKVVIPHDIIEPILHLTLLQGVKCQFDKCNELRGTENSMVYHCKVAHQWIRTNGVLWSKQCIQTFFQSSNRRFVSIVVGINC